MDILHKESCPGTVVWICALRAEAKPLIDHFALDFVGQFGSQQLYRSGSGIALVVAGVGAHAVASAVGLARGQLVANDCTPSFLNVGISGHTSRPKGTLYSAHQVILRDKDSDAEAFHPIYTRKRSIPSDRVWTVTTPETRFVDEGGYDMEAAHFFGAAVQYCSAERVAVWKVVSDGPGDGGIRLRGPDVEALIAANLDALADEMQYYQSLSHACCKRARPPENFEALLACSHYTVSQQHQLRELLRRRQAWAGHLELPTEVLTATRARDVIDYLANERIERAILDPIALHEPEQNA